jgi:FkbM family methyltransferase
MTAASLRKALPPPLKRTLKVLAGWAYSLRRWLKARRAGADGQGSSGSTHGVAEEYLSASNEHGSYCVPSASRHRPVSQAILQSRVWEADTLDLLRGVDSDGDIVHAGTFFGDFLPALARSRTGGALVWAFEPSAENHRCTERTIELNALENVRLARAGLDVAGGVAQLATADREGVPLGGASRVIKDASRARWFRNEEIGLVSVDETVGSDRLVAAIHLDVEGHEQSALTGALETIARCKPLIVVETLPEASWIEENLEPLGYRLEGQVNINHVLRASPAEAGDAQRDA